MRVFAFTEQPYPDAWGEENPSLRVDIPSRHCDPRVMGDLYHRYLDEWLLADELGYGIMVNEHHATATCVSSAAGLTLAILARQTLNARLLTLGYPIANRLDPVRMAEELAMIDVISRGRLEIGFVRGVPYELSGSVRSAVGMVDRFWEAHDLILKALTTHDALFDWQGEHFHYRNVNVWPRVAQAPHPPVWISARSPSNVREVAEKGYVLASFLSGYQTDAIFDVYRSAWKRTRRDAPPADRFAYLGVVAVAADRREARARAEIMAGYLRTLPRISAPFGMPPGYASAEDRARMMAGSGGPTATTFDGRRIRIDLASVEDLVDAGIMFTGTPDDVHDQIVRFREAAGGFGNLLMMSQAANLSHRQTVDNLRLFAREIMPRLADDVPA